ncbi:hypothetical protein Pyn_40046 [Prunus yedoensis var. nudiflora]|uniref:Uncharacterized protein n=1 Tax=Prunus yedoensis var. nudiflora TaxID=2094558 RepID=A0A314UAL3_PRUYE|nr:hypothetical protein Pyn_40046 [Prunus yedoensis var. nudiflora]
MAGASRLVYLSLLFLKQPLFIQETPRSMLLGLPLDLGFRAVVSVPEVKFPTPECICWFSRVLIEGFERLSSKNVLEADMVDNFHLRLGCQFVVPSIVGFGSGTSSRNQVMQCYCLLSTDGSSGVPQRCIVVIVWDSYRSTCFDESSSRRNADWSCSTLLGFCCC